MQIAVSCTQSEFRFVVRAASEALGAARLQFAVGSGRCWPLFKLIRDAIQKDAREDPGEEAELKGKRE